MEDLLRSAPRRAEANPPDRSGGEEGDVHGRRFSPPGRPAPDPVFLVRRYSDPRDQEIAGMITALLAYGRVDLICRAAQWVLDRLTPTPHEFLAERKHLEARWGSGFRYRFNSRADLIALLEAMASAIRDHGGLGASLALHRSRCADLDGALAAWVAELRQRTGGRRRISPGLRFLLPDPGLGGACKRWHLYLRWMVRPDNGIDLGTWKELLSASELILPLDTHWIRIGARLGMTRRRTPGRRMAEEITGGLRRLHPSDPLRYDFALCHLGIRGGCPPRLTAASCRSCPLRPICPTSRSFV